MGIRKNDMKGWLRDAKREKDLERRKWELVVILVQVTFEDCTVPGEVSWEEMVLLPKGKGSIEELGW